MIVVSDTSPLNYLILIDAIEVLPDLFGEVHVPKEVMDELARCHAPASVSQWAASPPAWVRVGTPSITLAASSRLDPGETQAIALAIELHAAAILIDERKGRRVAKEHGLEAIGTLTVLELAAERKLLELGSALAALRRTSFRCSDELIMAALEREAARMRLKLKPPPML